MATLISEFQSNPPGNDPSSQTFKLSGTPGESFDGTIISIESDDTDSLGTVDRTTSVSGTFDANGLDFFESLEAMRVTAQDPLAIAGTNGFGEIFTVVDNGANATGISESLRDSFALRGTLNISPDDFNPEKVQIDEDTGIFDFDFPNVDVGSAVGLRYRGSGLQTVPIVTIALSATLGIMSLMAEAKSDAAIAPPLLPLSMARTIR